LSNVNVKARPYLGRDITESCVWRDEKKGASFQ
jgi:hypothetical protein